MYFEFYKNDQGQWRWRAKGDNHEIIAHGEGYKAKASVQHVIALIKREAATARVIEL